MTVESPIQAKDLVPVRARISWAAVLAGSVIALALYFLLTLLGGAAGLSISGSTTPQTLGMAAMIWAIAVTATCLFTGGFMASQLTTGENPREAALYGIVVWAVVFAALMWLMATGVRGGFTAMAGVAMAGTSVADAAGKTPAGQDWEAVARQAGFDQKQIDDVKQKAKDLPAQAKATAEDPATKARLEAAARDAGTTATKAAWYTFFGTWISMLAAAAGGYVGAGPTFRVVKTVNDRNFVPVRG